MARPTKVPVTYAFGRRDRIDPKLAPFGVLKTGRNLRVRKDGRLGTRQGYTALTMSTANGGALLYDLHEYRGRLLALGSDSNDPYPTDLFEYLGTGNAFTWRGNDPVDQRETLNPFTELVEVAGIPQTDDGVLRLDAASGDGTVCLVYSTTSDSKTFALVVDAATDQTLHAEQLPVAFNGGMRIVFAGGVFYVGVATGAGPNSFINVYSYEPHVSTAFTLFLSAVGSAPLPLLFDMCAVTHPSVQRIALIFSRTTNDPSVMVFNAAGAQLGSTITVTGTALKVQLEIEADFADNTINVLIRDAGGIALRTYNFAGTLLDGPTALATGVSASMARLGAQFAEPERIAVGINDGSGNVVVQFWDQDAHTLTASVTVQRAFRTSRLISGQTFNQQLAVVFAGIVGDTITTTGTGSTNALFFVTPDVAHMTTGGLREARFYNGTLPTTRVLNLTFDSSTAQLCWVAVRDPGVLIPVPVVTLVSFQRSERRASAAFGGLIYFAGGTPSVYDGRFAVPLNFNELPYIISATSLNGSGSLAVGARYLYILNWEYTLADGSVIVGPASPPFALTVGVGHDTASVVAATPHTVSVACGDALFGANVSAVLYRTDWDSAASTPGSVFRRCQTVPVAIGMANYGAPVTITDGLSDADIGDEEILYTQDERFAISSPLQHTAPPACTTIAPTEARLLVGGLTKRRLVQVSKSAYPNEAFEFNPRDTYTSSMSGDVTGVASLDGIKLAFTRDAVYALSGDGPDDLGIGTLSAPVAIPSPGGLSNPWSLLLAPDGLWFQLDDTKLFRMPRGGGSPTWEGVDVQDTLVDFPLIVGTVKHRGDNVAVFACNDVGNSTARFLVRDFRTEQWFEDIPLLTGGFGVEALCGYGDTIAYLSGRSAFVQGEGSFYTDDGTFISTLVVTQSLYPFGVGGYGQIYELLLTGEYRGDCTVTCRVSYDDGLTFVALESFDLESLATGQTIQRKWTLSQDITSSIVIEIGCIAAPGGISTEGFVYNQVDLLVEAEEGLRQLDPAELG